MKSPNAFRLAVLFTLVSLLSSRDVRQTTDVQVQKPEERELVTRKMMEEYLKDKDDLTGSVLALVEASAGAAMTLSTIDYSQSGGQVALEVANAVAPVIGTALALIPGVGPLISGIFMGVWGLVSPLFEEKEKEKENPMEKMINQLAKDLEFRMDEKLSSIINRAVHGEITRNHYVCNKYNFILHLFSKQLDANKSLVNYDALIVSSYLNDCDNFLKDTAGAFVYDEYANVLWVPSAITTSVRLSFLTEVIKYGHLIGFHNNVTAMYFRELQDDIKRQFHLHFTGHDNMRNALVQKETIYDDYTDYLLTRSKVQEAACQMQSQLWYFDREVYPYGIPQMMTVTELFSEINMADYFNPQNETVKHLQIFFDVYRHNYPGVLYSVNTTIYNMKIMNCIMGPVYHRIPSVFWFVFHAIPSMPYSYEFRIMYLQTYEYSYRPPTYNIQYPVPVLMVDKESSSEEFQEYKAMYAKKNLGQFDDNGINLKVEFVRPSHPLADGSKKIIDMPMAARWEKCPFNSRQSGESMPCSNGIAYYKGMFRMYSAGTYNLRKTENLNKIIRVGNASRPFRDENKAIYVGFVVGTEIILRKLIN